MKYVPGMVVVRSVVTQLGTGRVVHVDVTTTVVVGGLVVTDSEVVVDRL